MSHEEPPGYRNTPGFVKSNPKNNQEYLDASCIVYPEWEAVLREADRQLQELVPGYNIAQIKEKFGGLRFYIDLPEGTSADVCARAWEIESWAERTAPMNIV